MLLLDEISLADDAVIERLNSVLEPGRTLFLAEKGGNQVETIVAAEKFRILATMNPGGDFGKKELSPAMRNRFTEIWVPSICHKEDLLPIIQSRLDPDLEPFGQRLMEFVLWFNQLSNIIFILLGSNICFLTVRRSFCMLTEQTPLKTCMKKHFL